MANLTWSGAGDGITWSSLNNWTDDSTGLTAAAAPATGDSVKILTGSWSISAGLSNAAVTLVNMFVGPSFTGTIGTSGSYLTIAISGTLTYKGNASICNIYGGTANIATCKVVSSLGTFRVSGGTVSTLEVGTNGNVEVLAAAIVTTLKGTGGNCSVEYNATGLTTVEWGAGSLVSARSVATGTVAGVATSAKLTGIAAVSTLMTVGGGSTYTHDSTGTITNIKGLSGSKVLAGPNIAGFTVTNSTEFAGADFLAVDTGLTFSNATTTVGF